MLKIMNNKEKIIRDIKFIENSKMFIGEKKYYINLIDILNKLNYYENRETLKELWSK